MNKGAVLKYTLLPEIFPRLKTLFGNGFFRHLSFLIAYIFNAVRILPNNHPALSQSSKKRFTIRQVLAAAANNITFAKKNIDQIIVFFAVITGLILFVLQFITLIASLFIKAANAAAPALPAERKDFFITANPSEDVAFRLLDLVFGIPNFFGSKEAANFNAFHNGLQAMLEFYSIGILFVSGIIIIYFVVAIVAETAQSGTPFGQRFSHSWAAIRLIIFFGLIIPITSGLNGGQFLMLASAKFGSGLATNAWVYFLGHLEDQGTTLAGGKETLIATPEADISAIAEIPAFMLIVKTCDWAYGRTGTEIKPYILWGDEAGDNEELALSGGKTFQQYVIDSEANDLTLVFGTKEGYINPNYTGGINPLCGSLTLPVADVSEPGSAVIQTAYFDFVKDLWFDAMPTAGGIPTGISLGQTLDANARNYTFNFLPIEPRGNHLLPAEDMSDYIVSEVRKAFPNDGTGPFAQAVEVQLNGVTDADGNVTSPGGDFSMPDEIKNLGWGGAGVWYNKIAQQNGALVSSAKAIPRVKEYPAVMENVREMKLEMEENITPKNQFTPRALTDAFEAELYDYGFATTLNAPYIFWMENKPTKTSSDNIIFDTLNVIFGTQGLFDMCKNALIHPLAQLSSIGKSMIESSISVAGLTIVTTFFGATSSAISGTTFAFSQFFGAITSVGLLIGFILFYVMPFMPFLYFFFAVGGWLKSIFEAIVAVPIWALAHLRIDGDGIPGEAGLQGYFLLFEIFIRPVLIIFGLIAAITIFAAMVRVLNEVFYLAVANLAGFDGSKSSFCGAGTPTVAEIGSPEWVRGPVDEFFFTIMYAIIVYMIGMASFKLIDMIPNNILRWISAEVSSFNDSNEDAASGLLLYISMAGNQFGSQLSSGMSNIGASLQARPNSDA